MDEVYRNYRIATKQVGAHWVAKVYDVRGPLVSPHATASLSEGEAECVRRARLAVDRYISYLANSEA